MTLNFDPEVADVLAQLGGTDAWDTAYATKLSRVGVPAEFHLHPGVPHEFDSIAFNSDIARRAIADPAVS
jgi:acetyl esterase/lipase